MEIEHSSFQKGATLIKKKIVNFLCMVIGTFVMSKHCYYGVQMLIFFRESPSSKFSTKKVRREIKATVFRLGWIL